MLLLSHSASTVIYTVLSSDNLKQHIQLEVADDMMAGKDDKEILVMGFQAYSRERTRERYYMIFVWEIAQGRMTGYDLSFSTGRTGRYCYVRKVDPALDKEQQKREENSLSVKGAKLFNMLPAKLRNNKGDISVFTLELYNFIADIPDNPKCPYRECKEEENSLLKLIPKHSTTVIRNC